MGESISAREKIVAVDEGETRVHDTPVAEIESTPVEEGESTAARLAQDKDEGAGVVEEEAEPAVDSIEDDIAESEQKGKD